ncbi:TfoX/Sxy family protein [Undibacterium arcticum]
MVMGNSLYFAVNDVTRPKYQKMGSDCFRYATKKGRVDVTRFFYEVPGELLESPAQLMALATEAIGVAASYKNAVKVAPKVVPKKPTVARKPTA